MTYTIDIAKDNIRHLTAQEIRDYTAQGLLMCQGVCLSEFVNKLMVDCIDQQTLDEEKTKAYNEGYNAKVNTYEIERAISILQDFVDSVED